MSTTSAAADLNYYRKYLCIVDMTCLSSLERHSVLSKGYNFVADTRWLPYNLTFDPVLRNWSVGDVRYPDISANASFPQPMLVHGCLYVFDEMDVSNIVGNLMAAFNGTVRGDSGGNIEPEGDNLRLNASEVLQTIYDDNNVSFDSISQIMDNTSDALTNFLRQQTDPKYNNPAQGTMYHNQTCLGVRWPWLALPATLALVTLALFIAMLIESRPGSLKIGPIWKSSLLALLFHGLELSHRRQIDGYDVDGMEKVAGKIGIRLETTVDGLKLVEVAGNGQGRDG